MHSEGGLGIYYVSQKFKIQPDPTKQTNKEKPKPQELYC